MREDPAVGKPWWTKGMLGLLQVVDRTCAIKQPLALKMG